MRKIIFIAFTVSLVLAGLAMGQGNGNGNGHKSKSQNQTGGQFSGTALTVSLMPPGIAKRYFPSDLMGQLPPRPGQQWLVMGTDILLIDVATQLVLDVLHR